MKEYQAIEFGGVSVAVLFNARYFSENSTPLFNVHMMVLLKEV